MKRVRNRSEINRSARDSTSVHAPNQSRNNHLWQLKSMTTKRIPIRVADIIRMRSDNVKCIPLHFFAQILICIYGLKIRVKSILTKNALGLIAVVVGTNRARYHLSGFSPKDQISIWAENQFRKTKISRHNVERKPMHEWKSKWARR